MRTGSYANRMFQKLMSKDLFHKADATKSEPKGKILKSVSTWISSIKSDMAVMISLLKDFKSGAYRDVSWTSIGAILFAIAYLIAPIDIIPDFVPVLGYLDDIIVFYIALKFIRDDLNMYLQWKQEEAGLTEESSVEIVETLNQEEDK